MAILTGRTRHYDPSEIIVAQPDLKQVLGELERQPRENGPLFIPLRARKGSQALQAG